MRIGPDSPDGALSDPWGVFGRIGSDRAVCPRCWWRRDWRTNGAGVPGPCDACCAADPDFLSYCRARRPMRHPLRWLWWRITGRKPLRARQYEEDERRYEANWKKWKETHG